jgi:hypothetical protein
VTGEPQPLESPTVSLVEPAAPAPVESDYVAEPLEETTEEVAPAAPETGEPHVEAPVENVVTMAEEAFTPAAPDAEEASAADQLLRSIEEARGLRESLQKVDAPAEAAPVEAGPAETAPVEAAPAEAAPETPAAPHEEPAMAEPAAPYEEPIQDMEVPFVLDEPEELPPGVEQPVPEAQRAAFDDHAPSEPPTVKAQAAPEPQAAAPQAAAAEPPKPTAAATQDFLFEPYHTIDYFASQGIKLSLDEQPQDKLGKQLKSFTEWLKTMRRLPQKDREVVPDRVAEEAVQTSAAHSIQGKDILTETMAEVLAKQGMREKARAVYEKLSLLNPDKRAYFAAKIEQLNIP